MILKETTVYVPIKIEDRVPPKYQRYFELVNNTNVNVGWFNGNSREHLGATHWLEEKENQYTFSKESLIELLGSVWDEACTQVLNGIQAGFLHPQHQSKFKLSDRELIQAIGETIVNYPIPDNDKYINNLFNTEEYGK